MDKKTFGTTLYLIRHGQTEANASQRLSGWLDSELSDIGVEQAQALAARLETKPLKAIYSSDLKRTQATAGPIARLHSLKVQIVPQLKEMNFGNWEGRTLEQLLKEGDSIYKKWMEDPSATVIPGGEDFSVFKERVVTTIRSLLNSHPNQHFAIVTHGGPIGVFLCDILNLPASSILKIPRYTAALNVIEFFYGQYVLRAINDTDHLKGI